jgi:hypothetical protein
LVGLGCPKQAFAKIAPPSPITVARGKHIKIFTGENISNANFARQKPRKERNSLSNGEYVWLIYGKCFDSGGVASLLGIPGKQNQQVKKAW